MHKYHYTLKSSQKAKKLVAQVFYALEKEEDKLEDAELIEIIKARENQPSIPVDIDDL
ncbi:hypothetical protein [Zooshikella ganghwensis]|uniref:hypothetical protein n=1 Tax=Zooshikella ganghwensis TaxID=202772 RepID=UPI000429CE67|nr:hypothetical protein [Zooshikella ganghwensis]